MRTHSIRALAAGFLGSILVLENPVLAFDDGTTPYVPSPTAVVERMLQLAQPRAGERLIDLGSGDGRIVIEAAKRYGAKGLGVDLDPRLVNLAQEGARRAGVEQLARFEVRDLFETDLRGADVVTMYLLPDVNRKLLPKLLAELHPGARIVSHDYDLGAWQADESVELMLPEKMVGPLGRSRVFLWHVPSDARGVWTSEIPAHGGAWRFEIAQSYQQLDVRAVVEGRTMPVRGAAMRGEHITVSASGVVSGKPWNHLFRGTLQGNSISGDLSVSSGEQTKTYTWKATRIP